MKFKVGDRVRLTKRWTGAHCWRYDKWRISRAADPAGILYVSNGRDDLPAFATELDLVRGTVPPQHRSRVDAGPKWGC